MKNRPGAPYLRLSCALICIAMASMAVRSRPPAVTGFTPSAVASQQALEHRFDELISAADLNDWMKRMASGANNVGAPHNRENAEFILRRFRAWGWDARIEQFDVLYPTLRHHLLELVEPTKFTASLAEPSLAADETSARRGTAPSYYAYGADGDVTADLVYVNYGMPDDYKDLTRRGVDVKGKIVIARYGQGWRGLKPKIAYEHGAVGCLIYSDPKDDGYFMGDVYPKGTWRPAGGVHRGAVMDMPVYPGDPLTPGVGATKKEKRLPLAQAKSVLKIPVVPLSYGDAQPLLAALEGPVAPAGWRGALPLTYHVGPGPAKVHLVVESEWSLKALYNVIAKISGTQSADEWVIRGNHHDGAVFGASDPLSGHVAMLAEAKAIGALLKTGWTPKRTIIYASWDGDAMGLLGSTEWAETHARELQRKAVVYLDSDINARGFLRVSGSHSLQHFMNEVAASVKDPQTGTSVLERLRAKVLVDGYERGASHEQQQTATRALGDGDLPIDALSSNVYFMPFLQHLGIATLNIEYGGVGDLTGLHHSTYDTFEHYSRFSDPQFAYGVAEAQTVGHAVLRIADADVLPMKFAAFADTVREELDELHNLTDVKRQKANELDLLLKQNAFALASDPALVVRAPEREAQMPSVNFALLEAVVARLKKSATAYDEAYERVAESAISLKPKQRRSINAQLRGLEQSLLYANGLPGREWYKHLVYAPGLRSGFGVKTLPAVREAIEDNRWEEANQYLVITAAVLGAYCDRLEKVTALLK